MSMQICMISYHTCPLAAEEGKETGGMNIYVRELAQELAKMGHCVDVYTRNQEKSQQLEVILTKGLRIIHLNAGPSGFVPKKDLNKYIPEFINSYFDYYDKNKLSYNVLHVHYYLSGLAALKINDKLRLPLIMSFHTLALMKNLVARTESERESPDRIRAEYTLVKKANKIISPSESDQNYLIHLYKAKKDKLIMIPPGVDTHLFKPMPQSFARQEIGANPNHKIILFVGRIEPLKGIDSIFYALKIIKNRYPRSTICLWIVGGDITQKLELWSEQMRVLEKLRRDLHLSSSIKFIGQKKQHELPYYYNAADVVVMPSLYESFGMAALEAMACGVPVVTSNVSGISTLLDEKHELLITSANNPLHLASQIQKLILNKKEHAKISRHVFLKVQDLSWLRIASQIAQVYRSSTV